MNEDRKVKEMFEAGVRKGEKAADSLLMRLATSRWTLLICALAVLFVAWHIVN